MGGFAALLGHAASGYQQEARLDQQRQFQDEQNRRQTMVELLSKLASDESVHPDIRSWATQTALQGVHEPYKQGKAWAPDFKKMPVPPGQAAQTAKVPGITQVPTPPPSLNVTPAQDQPLPAGQSGPPSPATGAPTLSTPALAPGQIPQPPAGLLDIPASTVTLAAQPSPGIFMSPEQKTQMLAGRAGAESGAQVSGQIAARQAAIGQIPGIPPELQAGLALGVPMYRTMNQTVGSGGGYAGQLRAQGEAVPTNIPDEQWVNLKELGSGRKTYEPGAAPGEKAGGGGTLVNPTEQAQRNAQTRYGIWQKENATQFSQRIALQNNAFSNAIQRGYYGDADKIFTGAVKDYQLGINRMRTMDANYADALKGNQQAMVSLVMNHIGMTAGAQPGMRMARATIEEAMKSAPWLSTHINKWFHQDETGDYIFDGLKGGITLTKPQMEQMVGLAHQKVNVLHDTIGAYQEALNPSTMEVQAPGMSQAQRSGASSTPASKKKPSTSVPPAPPASVRPPLSSFGPH